MKLPLKIMMRHLPASPALEEAIRARVGKLDEAHTLIRCDVVVEAPHRHARRGRLYTARVCLTLPGAEIVATHDPHEDPYVAVRLGFDAAKRQLEERLARRRSKRAA